MLRGGFGAPKAAAVAAVETVRNCRRFIYFFRLEHHTPSTGAAPPGCVIIPGMTGKACDHCKKSLAVGEPHDCWTTTEAALTRDLTVDLREAWQRLRETVVAFGEQKIYASHKSIMFSRRSCYFFVRPKRAFLEVCVFLGRELKVEQVRRVDQASKSKFAHLIRITHRDQVEPPFTDWLWEAYEFSGKEASRRTRRAAASK